MANELDSGTREALRAVRESTLTARIKQILRDEPAADRAGVVSRYDDALKLSGDPARGATVYVKQCLSCHTVQGRGHRVGPDLSGIGGRPKQALLVDVFDPNRQVSADFVSYTLVTNDGQVLSGLLAGETATSVTLRRAEGASELVLRSQIEQLRASGKSLMPEGIEQNLSHQDVADLFEFLERPDARLFPSGE
jgi:putative heme-binding domain-containing protein